MFYQIAASVLIPPRPLLKKSNNLAIESSEGFSMYDFENLEGGNPNNNDNRIGCPDCGRKFLPES